MIDLPVHVLTSTGLAPGRGHRDVAVAAIDGGASAVQLRAPELDGDELLALAEEISGACRRAGVAFIVNDRVDVARTVGAGVHVGQADRPDEARRLLGLGSLLGVSVSSPSEARAAEQMGADYLGVTVWATATKPEARPVGPAGLRGIASSSRLPVIGIGGIDAGNVGEVMAAGAAGIAVVSAVGAAADPRAATRRLVEAVRSSRREAAAERS